MVSFVSILGEKLPCYGQVLQWLPLFLIPLTNTYVKSLGHRLFRCWLRNIILNLDILQGGFRLFNWLSLRRLVSWINHLPPACWSTFWESIFKHQLGCRLDILDSISSLFFILTYAIIYVLIHHIIFGFIFTSYIFFFFFKYSCTNIFHRRSICTFYRKCSQHSHIHLRPWDIMCIWGIQMPSFHNKDSQYKATTVSLPSYLYNGNFHT